MKNSLVLLFFSFGLLSCYKEVVRTNEEYKVVNFPDGSVGLLNINSEVQFEKDFKNREVIQKGEIFYFVIKSKTPFVVKTEMGEVNVLGTEFNVLAKENKFEVEVQKGEVEVKANEIARTIRKNEKAIINATKNEINIAKADYKYKKWVKIIMKDILKASKAVEKEGRVLGKDLNNELKKIK